MKNVVMGTAGHIDHGKTALVRRLTGIDTDRLQEEKKRGMTIELGFAPLTLPSGNVVSIIDVPGHEKFIKTMVAGVTGIDFVMLVVAADEGVMPQTREHIDILSLLNVKSGVVALTKVDLVDGEWLELAREDVEKSLAGTTLQGIPIVDVSAVTGYGMDNLIMTLESLSREASEKESQEFFRLPVDRVFTITGYGTVVTGTVSGGKISRGDSIELLPSGRMARVRGIQVHNIEVEHAGSGDRCALNLSGIDKEDIKRGDVAASPDIMNPAVIVDAVLQTVKGKEGIIHNQRVHVHLGTKEVLARVRILGADDISSGDRGFVQLRFEEPVAVLRGDRFIIRSFSPVATLGGGFVIFHSTINRRRYSEADIKALEIGEKGNNGELVNHVLENSDKLLEVNDIWKELLIERNDIQKILNDQLNSGNVIWMEATDKYLSINLYNIYYVKIKGEFEKLYKKYPYRFQIDREEIKSKVFNNMDSKEFSEILNQFIKDTRFEMDGNFIYEPGNSIKNRISAMKETVQIEKAVLEGGFNAKGTIQLKQDSNFEEDRLNEIIRFLLVTGRIADLGSGIFIHLDILKKAVNEVRKIIDMQGSASAAQIRDALGIGRKVAIALMEYLDRLEITERINDVRKPGARYLDLFI